ncbi:NAD-dependent epimerase/dehydratase family protein [Paraflavitalea soli]|uniref:NAD-dependent epimerase/dehydratase family protein n=1 Tax=Paraflavitalea soli TaxID=2315862 RepID=A0A3B7N047_9BACT|nr:NAD(P)H-binding protein [Paraflavitalea soli]AXY77365.1 NAD-dependent epimerase/dehydratase family protein [Paraflavitalea soli]
MHILKIALVGATGFIGSAILQEALSRGHTVTAMARDPGKIIIQHNKLHILPIDVLDTVALTTVLIDHDVIISAWNPGWGTANLYEQLLEGSISIQRAAKRAAVPRLLVVGHAGSLYIGPSLQWVDAPEYPASWRPASAASRDYLNLLQQESQLDWTYITPPLDLVPGTRTGQYNIGTHSPVYNAHGKSTISVQDLAVAVLDEAESPRHSRRRFTVAY